MTTDQTDYEIFVSYARKDNRPIPDTFPHGWVAAVTDFIVADHRQYSADPMRIFFDTAEIRDMDDWKNRILGALRRSKVLLVCLSPNYFASQPCRWDLSKVVGKAYSAIDRRRGISSEPTLPPNRPVMWWFNWPKTETLSEFAWSSPLFFLIIQTSASSSRQSWRHGSRSPLPQRVRDR